MQSMSDRPSINNNQFSIDIYSYICSHHYWSSTTSEPDFKRAFHNRSSINLYTRSLLSDECRQNLDSPINSTVLHCSNAQFKCSNWSPVIRWHGSSFVSTADMQAFKPTSSYLQLTVNTPTSKPTNLMKFVVFLCLHWR